MIEVKVEKLLAIIGRKDVELSIMAEKIAILEREIQELKRKAAGQTG